MEHELSQTIALLRRTPGVLDGLLRGLPDDWTLRNEGANTWSAYDVVGHLIDGERTNWLPRVRTILEHGEESVFAPVDRVAQFRDGAGASLAELLDRFAGLRSDNVRALEALQIGRDDLRRRGRHPVFGPVTLSELLATWAAHDLTHLHQISRLMAYQYREAVGPWSRYLGVLHCAGHSEPA
jgi:hypothetical protein